MFTYWRSAFCAMVLLLLPQAARAVPSFALQTGQPCASCHVGAFGPQLTAFGRNFKISGYTQTGGEGWQAAIPVSVMLLGSYSNTDKGQGAPASEHYGANGNFAMDQIAVFLGGRVTENLGGLVQGSFSGITSNLYLDNSDIRASVPFDVGSTSLRVGLDVNNGPTVQDPFGASFAWGYPYVGSSLVPKPAQQPLLAGALIGNSVGATVYGWYDQSLYVEAGLYNTYGPRLLGAAGTGYGPGSTANPAPYARVAYEWNWGVQSAYLGGMFLSSNFNPATSQFVASGANGHNSYTDYALDGGWQWLGDGTHVFSALAVATHEDQKLTGLYNVGGSSRVNSSLNQIRADVSYYYQQTYGATLGWQKTWGPVNALLNPANALSGSANGKPNSNAFSIEADWVPFGKSDSYASPWANLKLGASYTLYTQFNGAAKNYDGGGRNASDNNTLYVFAWMLF